MELLLRNRLKLVEYSTGAVRCHHFPPHPITELTAQIALYSAERVQPNQPQALLSQ